MGSIYVSSTNNHSIKRLSLGYGLFYAVNAWQSKTYADQLYTKYNYLNRYNQSIGFVFPAYFNLGYNFNLGLVYRPSFIRLNSKVRTFSYEHSISLDFAWKIKLTKFRKS